MCDLILQYMVMVIEFNGNTIYLFSYFLHIFAVIVLAHFKDTPFPWSGRYLFIYLFVTKFMSVRARSISSKMIKLWC